MPSPVHETCASVFIVGQGIAASLVDSVIAHRIEAVGPQDVRGFNAKYGASAKQPDALFKYEQANGAVLYSSAVEVGFSEKYEDLLEDMKMWIEGRNDVMTVILISVEELDYHCPTSALEDDEIIDLFPDYNMLDTSVVHPENPADAFGPLSICGLTWVSTTSAFLEIWKRDGGTGKAVLSGSREVSYFSIALEEEYKTYFSLTEFHWCG